MSHSTIVRVAVVGLVVVWQCNSVLGQISQNAAMATELCAPDPLQALQAGDPSGLLTAGQPTETRRMADRLRQIRDAADPRRNPFRSAERVGLLRAEIGETADHNRNRLLILQLTEHLIRCGRVVEALEENEKLLKEVRQVAATGHPEAKRMLDQLLLTRAIAFLRQGEQENCLLNHSPDSCLFPIKAGGVHRRQAGSRGAVAVLSELLSRSPGDLRARWLLNIAAMTLGEYPAGVPPAWRLDPGVFASEYDIKRFPDVAASAGLDVRGLAGGLVVDDFDNDGLLDVMKSSWGLNDQLRVFRNEGDGRFEENTVALGLVGEVGGLNMIHCDYNNDGWVDVLVLRGAWLHTEGHYPASLLRNDGNGRFTDVTESAGLLRFHPTQSAVWFDFNGDGWLDLFIANESDTDEQHPCELFRNNQDGTFTECARETGVAFVGYYKGVASADYNLDGRPDLLLSRLDGPNVLLRNDGAAGTAWRFADVTEAAGLLDPQVSFPCWFWDYDNDGRPDLMISGYSIQDVGDIAADYLGWPQGGQMPRLYRNRGDGGFTDVTADVRLNKLLLTMGCNFGDLDNDGWLDLYIGTGNPEISTLVPNRMFRNAEGRFFQDVSESGGFGNLQKGHAIAFADLNNDGAQDVVSVLGGAAEADSAYTQLLANPGHGSNWLKLKLEGTRTNRAAVGARLKIVLVTPRGERVLHRTVGSGASFGANPFRQEIGLGDAHTIKRVEIFWPVTGQTQVVSGLQPNHSYLICEGVPAPQPVGLRAFPWPVTTVGTEVSSN